MKSLVCWDVLSSGNVVCVGVKGCMQFLKMYL